MNKITKKSYSEEIKNSSIELGYKYSNPALKQHPKLQREKRKKSS